MKLYDPKELPLVSYTLYKGQWPWSFDLWFNRKQICYVHFFVMFKTDHAEDWYSVLRGLKTLAISSSALMGLDSYVLLILLSDGLF